ncbi:MAG: hypothetical protein A2583_04290 [Bdellovibrionales bacterium RIFOXYD1_FULL_53_11]|nr:MAG: hypothetical protein A2583_04290 [Bdellovibrionales bacterium RIFOXYD1_FULL_53_11]
MWRFGGLAFLAVFLLAVVGLAAPPAYRLEAPFFVPDTKLASFDIEAIISRKLDSFPLLQKKTFDIIRDGRVDAKFKNLFNSVLTQTDLVVLSLTDEVKRERGGQLWEAGYFVLDQPGVFWRFEGRPPERNSDKYLIYVQNRPLSDKYNDLLSLIHELSHIQFFEHLDANIGIIRSMLPADMISVQAGATILSKDLYCFLAERYAHETKLAAHQELLGRHFDDVLWIYKDVGRFKAVSEVYGALSRVAKKECNVVGNWFDHVATMSVPEILYGNLRPVF